MKVTLNEIEKNLQGINNWGDVTEYQINNLDDKEEKSTQSEQQEERRIKKMWGKAEKPLGQLQMYHIRVIGVLEGEVKEQEIEKLIWKNNKRKLP